MKYAIATAIVLVGLVALDGCATGGKLTREQALAQHDGLSRLEAALTEARTAGVPDLAPDGFAEAVAASDTAMDEARRAKTAAADADAAKGLARLERARKDADRARDVLGDVLAPRDRARKAGAGDLFAADMAAADDRLRDVARLVEKGRLDEAKDRRVPLIEVYGNLELAALKKGTDQAAQAAIERARAAGADEHAPKTLALAEDELKVTRSILEANRADTARADLHAHRAAWLAARAGQITEMVVDFDRLHYTPEDTVLWYQDQLAMIAAPLGTELPFDTPNQAVVQGLAKAVAGQVRQSADLQGQLAAAQAQLADVEQRHKTELSAESAQRADAARREAEAQQRFDRVQSLFTAEEANVYRQRQNVLISAQGFWFPSGGSEIDAVNFPLLNKIVKAIREFPQARVQVMGHTDAAGDDALNQTLSQDRADKVAKFLVDVGGMDPKQVTAQGFGESRPVATNDTKEGRAATRRVEILIVNE
jgi:OOP family OmpA-OmpF porin